MTASRAVRWAPFIFPSHRISVLSEEVRRIYSLWTHSNAMKLLNCTSLEIEEYYGSSIPEKYAILSHTWESGEASFQDVGNTEAMASKPGWAKINQTCRLALEQGYSYAWIDTCCIDKTNFTELVEAINSMFKWYARSTICYAYLADVGGARTTRLQGSRWFTRGWTLQELIAPSSVEFYDVDWKFLGTRADLSDELQERTGIDKEFLTNVTESVEDMLPDIPIARRMSWAADRITTREEDLAYCLLGVFGVNMPLLYGEGSRAFIRLQEEIIKETHDTSIFAWSHSKTAGLSQIPQVYFGILATSPNMFAFAKTLEKAPEKTSVEYTMTNKGLRIETEVFGTQHDWQEMFMELGCRLREGSESGNLCILLRDQGDGTLVRSSPFVQLASRLHRINPKPNTRLLIRRHLNPRQSRTIEGSHGSIVFPRDVRIIGVAVPARLELVDASPWELWDPDRRGFSTGGLRNFHGFVRFKIVLMAEASPEWNSSGQDFCLFTWFLEGCLDQPAMCLATSTYQTELYNAVTAANGDGWKPLCRQNTELPAKVLLEDKAKQSARLVDRLKSKLTDRWKFAISCEMLTRLMTLREHVVSMRVTAMNA
ncbi:hypothetical protein K456DRAFT_1278621 [Colletotrichum gloeosporioides 23]|nr:hypothetical protein K456DRAFT_1278621 [Colletotrichum gloeosporioides 23]